MANEATIINNPDLVPGAVSSGYQRQNTLLTSLFNGIDYTVVEGGVGEVTVKISGPVDVNGVLYSIASDAVLTMVGAAGNYCIYLDGAGATLTPTLSAVGVLGTFDPSKNARYTAGGKRILNWLIYYDGATTVVSRWLIPSSDNNIHGFKAYISSAQMITSAGGATKIDFDTEIYDYDSCFDTVNNRFTVIYPGIYIIKIALIVAGLPSATYFELRLYKNGIFVNTLNNLLGNDSISCMILVTIIEIADMGDTYEIYGITNDAAISLSSGANFYFQAIRINNEIL